MEKSDNFHISMPTFDFFSCMSFTNMPHNRVSIRQLDFRKDSRNSPLWEGGGERTRLICQNYFRYPILHVPKRVSILSRSKVKMRITVIEYPVYILLHITTARLFCNFDVFEKFQNFYLCHIVVLANLKLYYRLL